MPGRRFTLVYLVLCALCALSFSQDTYYLDKAGPFPLWFSQDKVVIKLVEGQLFDGGFPVTDPAIDGSRPPQPAPDGFFYVYLLPGASIPEMMERLDTNSFVDLASPVYLDSNSVEYVPNAEILAQFQPGVSTATIDSMNLANLVVIAGTQAAPCVLEDWYTLQISHETGKTALEIANIYEQSALTQFAIPSFWVDGQKFYQPVDSFFVRQWNYNNTGQNPPGGMVDADIDAVEAWEWGLGDTSIVIAVIDDGVEAHEDIPASKLVPGYDFAGDDISKKLPPDNDPSPGDGCYEAHGMAVAGLIGATHNSIGVAGLAPNSKIMPVKVYDNFSRSAKIPQVASAFYWANFNGADIINYSSGYDGVDTTSPLHEPIKDAINCYKGSIVMVFAAGNSGYKVAFPANLSGILAVGAIDKFQEPADYTPLISTGDDIDLVAHSSCCYYPIRGDIWSTDIGGTRGRNNQCNDSLQPGNVNYLNDFGGTSAAAPQVAASAALLVSFDRKINYKPDLIPAQILEVLRNSAEDGLSSYDDPGFDWIHGYGRVNPMRALMAIARGDINKDGWLTLVDVNRLVDYYFNHVPITPHVGLGDVNCDGLISLADVIYLVNFVFNKPGGPWLPPICYQYNY